MANYHYVGREAHHIRLTIEVAVQEGTDLTGANLSGANLSGANLRRANLKGANLSGANLTGADLTNAWLIGTIIANTDLRTTKGLKEIRHGGPSVIELHTVQLPQGEIALHFLRAAGIPNEWIGYHTRTTHPAQYHSLFISYSSEDEELAKRLHADLLSYDVHCWFAPAHMRIGSKIRQGIGDAISRQDKLLLLLSKDSIASNWVEDEVEAAFEKENKQQHEVIFPIRLDGEVMQTPKEWAAKLRRARNIGDFTAWTDPQKYQSAFKRLLHDLKRDDDSLA